MGVNGGYILTKQLVVVAEKDKEILLESNELLNPGASVINKIDVNVSNLQYDLVVIKKARPKANIWPKIKVILQGNVTADMSWKFRVGKVYNKPIKESFSSYADFSIEKDYLVPVDYNFDYDRLSAEVIAKVENVSHKLISPSRLVKTILLGFEITIKQLELVKIPVGKN